MANYYGVARSNYFKINDEAKFIDVCSSHNLEYWEKDDYFAVKPSSDSGSFDDAESFARDLAPCLQDDQVCILMEIGNEKLRYLNAYAVVVNAKGEVQDIDLNTVATQAAKAMTTKPDEITQPTY